jgi:hypothetical protein
VKRPRWMLSASIAFLALAVFFVTDTQYFDPELTFKFGVLSVVCSAHARIDALKRHL